MSRPLGLISSTKLCHAVKRFDISVPRDSKPYWNFIVLKRNRIIMKNYRIYALKWGEKHAENHFCTYQCRIGEIRYFFECQWNKYAHTGQSKHNECNPIRMQRQQFVIPKHHSDKTTTISRPNLQTPTTISMRHSSKWILHMKLSNSSKWKRFFFFADTLRMHRCNV